MRRQRFIASLLVLIMVLSMTAFNNPLVGKHHRFVDHHAVDTALNDTILSVSDALPSQDVTD
ncbi:MAG: hypothetical protein J6T11_04675, partial [Bacteroidaceae bacterium]|nr:hypothetical protein [Bacteroidaceae bacterium]